MYMMVILCWSGGGHWENQTFYIVLFLFAMHLCCSVVKQAFIYIPWGKLKAIICTLPRNVTVTAFLALYQSQSPTNFS